MAKGKVTERGSIVATRQANGKTYGWAKMRDKRGNVRDIEVKLSKKSRLVVSRRKKSLGGKGG